MRLLVLATLALALCLGISFTSADVPPPPPANALSIYVPNTAGEGDLIYVILRNNMLRTDPYWTNSFWVYFDFPSKFLTLMPDYAIKERGIGRVYSAQEDSWIERFQVYLEPEETKQIAFQVNLISDVKTIDQSIHLNFSHGITHQSRLLIIINTDAIPKYSLTQPFLETTVLTFLAGVLVTSISMLIWSRVRERSSLLTQKTK